MVTLEGTMQQVERTEASGVEEEDGRGAWGGKGRRGGVRGGWRTGEGGERNGEAVLQCFETRGGRGQQTDDETY